MLIMLQSKKKKSITTRKEEIKLGVRLVHTLSISWDNEQLKTI